VSSHSIVLPNSRAILSKISAPTSVSLTGGRCFADPAPETDTGANRAGLIGDDLSLR